MGVHLGAHRYAPVTCASEELILVEAEYLRSWRGAVGNSDRIGSGSRRLS